MYGIRTLNTERIETDRHKPGEPIAMSNSQSQNFFRVLDEIRIYNKL